MTKTTNKKYMWIEILGDEYVSKYFETLRECKKDMLAHFDNKIKFEQYIPGTPITKDDTIAMICPVFLDEYDAFVSTDVRNLSYLISAKAI